jgi:hypothetical protein
MTPPVRTALDAEALLVRVVQARLQLGVDAFDLGRVCVTLRKGGNENTHALLNVCVMLEETRTHGQFGIPL